LVPGHDVGLLKIGVLVEAAGIGSCTSQNVVRHLWTAAPILRPVLDPGPPQGRSRGLARTILPLTRNIDTVRIALCTDSAERLLR
jgi:hypothetical protein